MLYYNGEVVNILREKDGWAYCELGYFKLNMWLPKSEITEVIGFSEVFNKNRPSILVMDYFYTNPDKIRDIALNQDYHENIKFYKGKRTAERFLWPMLKETFESLLNKKIHGWLDQGANGCFQITGYQDPLVWHSDTQSYAAAIYLTPDAPVGAGTSFWRSKIGGVRRPPTHPLEVENFESKTQAADLESKIYTNENFVSPDNWELVDKVGAVYNRLVIWDAKLIHSASTYEGFSGAEPDNSRLVQLFFFNVS